MRYELGMTDRIDIRSAESGDRDFVAGLASSLLAFGSPGWKNADELAPGFRKVLAEAGRRSDSSRSR